MGGSWLLLSIIAAPCRLQELTDSLQTVVDDGHALIQRGAAGQQAWARYHWRAGGGGGLGCGREGWKESFLYLDPDLLDKSEGSVELTLAASFIFNPQMDGCYLIEEFHPRDVCHKRMLPEVYWSIHYSKGLVKGVSWQWGDNIKGNRWNVVDMLPFYRGHEGKIIVTHPSLSEGWIPADAFRFTRIAEAHWCESSTIPQDLKTYQHLALLPLSVMLDDQHANTSGGSTLQMPCAESAIYEGAYMADHEEGAYATYVFEPPSMGCYRVDEYHPSLPDDCATLASAHVQVRQWQSMSWESPVNLSQSGNQWNPVGHFLFLAGARASITSRPFNLSHTAGSVWVADAFRLSKVSDTCEVLPYAAFVTLHIHGAKTNNNANRWSKAHGLLHLGLHKALADFFTVSRKHELQPLPLGSVHLLFFRMRGRATVVEVEFRGHGQADKNLIARHIKAMLVEVAIQSDSQFVRSLCRPFAAKPQHTDCRVEVVRSSVEEPHLIGNKDGDEKEATMSFSIPVHMAFTMSVCPAFVMAALILFMRRYNPRRAARNEPFNRPHRSKRGAEVEHMSDAFAEANLEVTMEEEEYRERSVRHNTSDPTSWTSTNTSGSSTPLLDDATSVISTNTPGSHRETSAYHRRRGDQYSHAVQDDSASSVSVHAPESCRGVSDHRSEEDVPDQDATTSADSSNTPTFCRASSVWHRGEEDSYPVFQDDITSEGSSCTPASCRSSSVRVSRVSSVQHTGWALPDIPDATLPDDDKASESETSDESSNWNCEVDDSDAADREEFERSNADAGMYRYPETRVLDKE